MITSPAAPNGLRFVQDLVNTALEAHAYQLGRDELADLGAAREWLRHALDQWALATGTPPPLIALRPDDLAGIQELRERLRAALRAGARNAPAAPAPGSAVVADGDLRLAVAPDGRMRYRPAADDARAITELVAAETLLAQVRGNWAQLKTCANPACGVCFFDLSPNRSRAWHNTRTCGNVSNLRASRARRK